MEVKEGGDREEGSLYQCRSCGQECAGTRDLYDHVVRVTRPGVPCCLRQLGYGSNMKEFKKDFDNMLRRIRVRRNDFLFLVLIYCCSGARTNRSPVSRDLR